MDASKHVPQVMVGSFIGEIEDSMVRCVFIERIHNYDGGPDVMSAFYDRSILEMLVEDIKESMDDSV